MVLSNNSNISPLFMSILNKDWISVERRLMIHPEEAQRWTRICLDGTNFSHLLPLHQASVQNPDPEVFRLLIRSYPEALQRKDSTYERLPLHYACLRSIASEDIIKILIEAYPQGALEEAAFGRLPLHYACSNGASKEIISKLLSVFEGAVKTQDSFGWLPIHIACLKNASVEVVKILLDAYPESVFVETEKENTPLLCARLDSHMGSNKDAIISLLKKKAKKLRKKYTRKMICVDRSKLNILQPNFSHNCAHMNMNIKRVANVANAEFC